MNREKTTPSPCRLTWLGHATWLIETPGGRRVLIDPWLDGNPSCPAAFHGDGLGPVHVIIATHGHADHVGDLVPVAKRTGATVVGIAELARWARSRGAPDVMGMNKGGVASVAGLRIALVDAVHSSSWSEGDTIVPLGEACGVVLELEDGYRVYNTGDTALFGDMRLIGELHEPDLVILPIGGHYTMGPREAAKALELIGAPMAIPNHYGTWPVLAGTPEELRRAVKGRIRVLAVEPGEHVEPAKLAEEPSPTLRRSR